MEKLIRDRKHLIPHPDYPNMKTRQVRDIHEHIQVLVWKITEEQSEIDTSSGSKKIEEIGDLLETYDTLIKLYENIGNSKEREWVIHKREALISTSCDLGINLIEILRIQREKREQNGGFENGVIWMY